MVLLVSLGILVVEPWFWKLLSTLLCFVSHEEGLCWPLLLCVVSFFPKLTTNLNNKFFLYSIDTTTRYSVLLCDVGNFSTQKIFSMGGRCMQWKWDIWTFSILTNLNLTINYLDQKTGPFSNWTRKLDQYQTQPPSTLTTSKLDLTMFQQC